MNIFYRYSIISNIAIFIIFLKKVKSVLYRNFSDLLQIICNVYTYKYIANFFEANNRLLHKNININT